MLLIPILFSCKGYAQLAIEYTDNLTHTSTPIEEQAGQASKESDALEQCHAYLKLGKAFYDGKEVPQNYEKARQYYEKALLLATDQRAHLLACYGLAKIYSTGQWSGKIRRWGEEPDYAERSKNYETAKSHFEKIANQNVEPNLQALAWLDLGELWFEGRCVPQNTPKAIEYFQKAATQKYNQNIASKAMDRMKQLSIADRAYFEVPQTHPTIKKTEMQADESKPPVPNNNLPDAPVTEPTTPAKSTAIILNEEGASYWQTKNYTKARECFEKVTQQTDDLKAQPRALVSLGIMYFRGQGVVQDTKKALDFYLQCAEQELDTLVQAQAILYLGEMFLNGQGLEKNFERALHYFEKAGNCKNSCWGIQETAWRYLIEMYYMGLGTQKNYDKARMYCERAEAQDLIKVSLQVAWYYLGLMYWQGLGVQKDPERARLYWSRASSCAADARITARADSTLRQYYYTQQDH